MSITSENENFLLRIKGEGSQTDACCIHQRTHLFKSLMHFFNDTSVNCSLICH